jgi:hypothetical protein
LEQALLFYLEKPASADMEKEVRRLLSTLNDNYFLRISGNYQLWQEVFSHQTDDVLFRSLVSRLSLGQLLAATYLSAEHDMRVLLDRYLRILTSRLTAQTLLPVRPFPVI